jgi:uncharacterized membrane protein YoaK (UPF0700 family)
MASRSIPVVHHYTLGLLILTMSTGCIDAVSYLALDRVFTGNMTGNLLFIAFGIVGVGGLPLLNNALALLGFVVGAIVGSRIVGQNRKQGLPLVSRWVLGGGVVIMVALAVYWLVVGSLDPVAMVVVTALLAFVMGAQVSAVKPVGNTDVTTIVVTSTLANISRDSRLAGGKGTNWLPRLGAIVAMFIGAAIGGGIIAVLGGPEALLAGAIIYTVGTFTLIFASRRH